MTVYPWRRESQLLVPVIAVDGHIITIPWGVCKVLQGAVPCIV